MENQLYKIETDQTSTEKKPYHPPVLRDYAAVREVTLASSSFKGSDSGSAYPATFS